jgi:hypothetical protein
MSVLYASVMYAKQLRILSTETVQHGHVASNNEALMLDYSIQLAQRDA